MADENSEEEVDGEKSGGGGSKKIFIVIGAIVLVLLLLVGGIMAALLSGGDEEMAPPTEQVGQQMMGGAPAEAMPNVRINKTYLKVGALYEMPLFVANLVSRKGKRYLRIKMNFEMDNESLMAELEMKKAVISDIVLSVLTSKTVEDLSSIKGKSRTKQEIIVTINRSLLDGKIKNIFFTEFIIQ